MQMNDARKNDYVNTYQTVRDKSSNAGRQYEFAPNDGDAIAVLRECYTNIARSPTTYPIRDFEIVEEETEFGSDEAQIEDLDYFRSEVRDFVKNVLFDGDNLTFTETTLTIPETHHVKIKEHTDGDVITVRFDIVDE